MNDIIHAAETNEKTGITTLEIENKYGRFRAYSFCDADDEYSRFDGYDSCELQIHRETMKQKAKALYQRYLGIYNAYKTLMQNYSEDDPVMQALWRQKKDAYKRYMEAKSEYKRFTGKHIASMIEARGQARELLRKRMADMNADEDEE